MFPPSKRQLSGPAAGCAVPSFHRLDCEAISEMDATPVEWLCERITQFAVAWNLNLELCEVRAKALDISQTAEVQTGQVGQTAHVRASLSHSRLILTGPFRFRTLPSGTAEPVLHKKSLVMHAAASAPDVRQDSPLALNITG